jgi:hypothetical protein
MIRSIFNFASLAAIEILSLCLNLAFVAIIIWAVV